VIYVDHPLSKFPPRHSFFELTLNVLLKVIGGVTKNVKNPTPIFPITKQGINGARDPIMDRTPYSSPTLGGLFSRLFSALFTVRFCPRLIFFSHAIKTLSFSFALLNI